MPDLRLESIARARLLAAPALALPAGAVTLADRRKPTASIVLEANATVSEQTAGRELAGYFQRISGAGALLNAIERSGLDPEKFQRVAGFAFGVEGRSFRASAPYSSHCRVHSAASSRTLSG
jgi:hypothetical protein